MKISSEQPDVVYVMPDKVGGVTNVIGHLVHHLGASKFKQHLVLTQSQYDQDQRTNNLLLGDTQTMVKHQLPRENLYSVLRRLRNVIPNTPGVLVANDWLELAMLCHYPIDRMVVQILHGDTEYYYTLAQNHSSVVDVFVALGSAIYKGLKKRLPDRKNDILYLPYGIPLSAKTRSSSSGPLRAIFSGRFHESKGVYDLPKIDQMLQRKGLFINWTMIGSGPEEQNMKKMWGFQPHVKWLGFRSNEEVRAIMVDHDIFILPTRQEGFSLALLEAMDAGLVPIVNDIPAFQEVVFQNQTGFKVPIGDIDQFVNTIEDLNHNRSKLNEMSVRAKALVDQSYDIHVRVKEYDQLFSSWKSYQRTRLEKVKLHYGSRLDHPWLPNWLVMFLRYFKYLK